MNTKNEEYIKYAYVIFGGFIFAAGVNLFIVPLNLYTGGVIGIAQIIRSVLSQYAHLDFGGFDIAGIINFAMNVPLFIMAYRSISRRFFIKTLLCVLAQTLAFTVVM
ncbi:MAG: YitT family protein, partial [Longicatena sp.]